MSRIVRAPQEQGRRAPAAEQRRTGALLGLLATAGLFAIVMIAAALQGVPQIRPPRLDVQPPPPPSETAAPAPTNTGMPEIPRDEPVAVIIAIILMTLLAAGAAALLFVIVRSLVRMLREMWSSRRLRMRDAGPIAADGGAGGAPDGDPEPRVIRRGIADAIRSLDGRKTPSDSIVAAWMALEETAADSGLSRGSSETAGEFALRIIARRGQVAEAAGDLLLLYERVRFGGLVAGEEDRAAARALLARIESGWR